MSSQLMCITEVSSHMMSGMKPSPPVDTLDIR